jgi:mannose-1-phosphate guanylyltransferase/mannose-1-phosphate guanylyltransferase/mannose-6-phosphate isomerase
MAGGSGARLWPASSSRKPKQFLAAAKDGDENFFSLSLERALRVVSGSDGRVIVITGKKQLLFAAAACSKLSQPEKKRIVLIPEPEAKNTAPAIACAIAYTGKTKGWNRTMLVLTSDHIIKPLEIFLKDIDIAAQYAEQNKLVIFGISPSGPETGYGYIEAEEREIAAGVYAVASFHEKPHREKAEHFFASKNYYWNSGMFAFRCDYLADEFRRIAADVSGSFEKLNSPDKKSYTKKKGLCVLDAWTGLKKAYRQAKGISFDYAIVEKCAQTVMIRAGFDWIDVGSWDDYARFLSGDSPADSDIGADIYAAETNGCFVDSDIPVALAGVEDLIVVIRSGKDGSPPAALVTRKGKTQLVRDVVEEIKQSGRKDIL